MNSRLALSILFSAVCLWAGQVHAGVWSQAKGGYYAKFSGIFYNAGEAFDGQGDRLAGNAWIDVLYDTVFSGKNVGAGSSLGIGLSISR